MTTDVLIGLPRASRGRGSRGQALFLRPGRRFIPGSEAALRPGTLPPPPGSGLAPVLAAVLPRAGRSARGAGRPRSGVPGGGEGSRCPAGSQTEPPPWPLERRGRAHGHQRERGVSAPQCRARAEEGGGVRPRGPCWPPRASRASWQVQPRLRDAGGRGSEAQAAQSMRPRAEGGDGPSPGPRALPAGKFPHSSRSLFPPAPRPRPSGERLVGRHLHGPFPPGPPRGWTCPRRCGGTGLRRPGGGAPAWPHTSLHGVPFRRPPGRLRCERELIPY